MRLLKSYNIKTRDYYSLGISTESLISEKPVLATILKQDFLFTKDY